MLPVVMRCQHIDRSLSNPDGNPDHEHRSSLLRPCAVSAGGRAGEDASAILDPDSRVAFGRRGCLNVAAQSGRVVARVVASVALAPCNTVAGAARCCWRASELAVWLGHLAGQRRQGDVGPW